MHVGAQDSEALPILVGCMSAEEADEASFQAAWLTYLWSRAAMQDVEPQVGA